MDKEDFTESTLAEPTFVYSQDGKPYFIDPLEDFSFKRIFGAEQNKALTIAFLNLCSKENER